MTTLTISKKITKGEELVIIPRRDYDRLLSDLTRGFVHRNPKIDRALAISMREFKKGKTEGPFNNTGDFMAFLSKKSHRPKFKKR